MGMIVGRSSVVVIEGLNEGMRIVEGNAVSRVVDVVDSSSFPSPEKLVGRGLAVSVTKEGLVRNVVSVGRLSAAAGTVEDEVVTVVSAGGSETCCAAEDAKVTGPAAGVATCFVETGGTAAGSGWAGGGADAAGDGGAGVASSSVVGSSPSVSRPISPPMFAFVPGTVGPLIRSPGPAGAEIRRLMCLRPRTPTESLLGSERSRTSADIFAARVRVGLSCRIESSC